MKLYYTPGTCSLVPHIVLRETGSVFSLARVDLKRHQIDGEGPLRDISTKDKVPVLALDGGRHLTEGPVIAQYIAERAGADELLPPPGDPGRYAVLEWQAFISSELHKSFSPLFNPAVDRAGHEVFLDELRRKFAWVDAALATRDYLALDRFTLADAYLFTVGGWAGLVGLDLSGLAGVQAHRARVAARPAVRAALQAEGLLKEPAA